MMKKSAQRNRKLGLVMLGLIMSIVLATSSAAFGSAAAIGEMTVEIIVGGEIVNHHDPLNPFIVNIPIARGISGNANGYVAVTSDSILPFSIYNGGEMTIITPRTGTYSVINNAPSFGDISGHWAHDNIIFASARELFMGTGEGVFSPNQPMTRAMFVQVLANIGGEELSVYNRAQFSDVSDYAWYAAATWWAVDRGLAGGVDEGYFAPSVNITREQMAVMLVNYLEYMQMPLPSNPAQNFSDEALISGWALDAVGILQRAGVIGGRPGNLFEPQGLATRAEVATIFAQVITAYVNYMKASN
ncbi:MAG: S-layer homology domain-containing protein [Defluviitaleaceae bacterium]|nr:S-layer homology domain-containing protein [Defluviitaleaceae bacterium]